MQKANLERDALAEPDVAGDGEVVELEDVGHAGEAVEEVVHRVERRAQLDDRRRLQINHHFTRA